MKSRTELMCDELYEFLTQIQKEEEVKLPSKALIADCLSVKLIDAGYVKDEKWAKRYRPESGLD